MASSEAGFQPTIGTKKTVVKRQCAEHVQLSPADIMASEQISSMPPPLIWSVPIDKPISINQNQSIIMRRYSSSPQWRRYHLWKRTGIKLPRQHHM